MFTYEAVRAAGCLSLPYLGSFLGLFAASSNMELYPCLKKPFLTPPAWIFRPAWSFFYGCMSVASLYALQEADNGAEVALPFLVYVAQLLLNWSWTSIYFGMKDSISSIAVVLAATIGAGISASLFYTVNSIAGYLMLPYVAWMCFVSYLNISTAMIYRAMRAIGDKDDKSKTNLLVLRTS